MTDSPTSDAMDGSLDSGVKSSSGMSHLSAGQSMLRGALLLVAAFLANTLQSAFGKAVGSSMDAQMFTWLTFLLALILLIPLLLLRRGRDLQTQAFRLHLLRAGTGMGGFLLFITAARLVNLVNANVLLNTTPLFIPLLALLVLKQRIARPLWLALAIGFAGMVIVVQPNTAVLSKPGDLLGLAAGLVCAVEFLTVKALNRTESALTQLAYFLGMGTLISTLMMLGQFHSISLNQGLLVLGSAVCLLSFQYLLICAYRFADPSAIGAFQYSSVVFAGLIGWGWFGQIPNLGVVLGTVLICIGGALSIIWQSPGSDRSGAAAAGG